MKKSDIIEFQMLSNELEQVEKFLEQLDNQTKEVTLLIDSLKEFKKLKTGKDIWFPITNGIFGKGKLENTNIVKINVGKGIIVEKNIDEAIELIKEQITNLIEQEKLAINQQERIYKELESLEKKVK